MKIKDYQKECLAAKISFSDWKSLTEGHHCNPHTILGLHALERGGTIIRLWRPDGASNPMHVLITGQKVKLKLGPPGLFYFIDSRCLQNSDYLIETKGGNGSRDPYSFAQQVGIDDQLRFTRGAHDELYDLLGARFKECEGVDGVRFAVWAPNAKGVSLIGDFNDWHTTSLPLRFLPRSGIWEIFLPHLIKGQRYKFSILTKKRERIFKADPFALAAQLRPDSASVIAHIDEAKWTDEQWMLKRCKKRADEGPISIYEVHLGSWKRSSAGAALNYRQIAPKLAEYVNEMNFTHVELLPITEYPLDESWGYQVGGYFAATCRYGSLEDFQFFVNHLHNCGIGIILDWVPGHFVKDDFGLSKFDGTFLFEHQEEHRQVHPHWGTKIFDHGRKEVSNFLIASALFWTKVWHLDGLRVDAVASMLYLDYGKEGLYWSPNKHGGHENLEAIEFIKDLNARVRAKSPGVLMIAEESTAWWGITTPIDQGGLGFDLKWNMGWMNDTLTYFARDCIYRGYHQAELTFAQHYAHTENFALVLSHDEVVHCKRSLLEKMPGEFCQKFANLRLLYSYMICQPGKKLIFQGGEWGVRKEWDCMVSLDWSLLNDQFHYQMQRLCKDLNDLYRQSEPLWEKDGSPGGFEWIDFSDICNCTISYFRFGDQKTLVCMHNFTPNIVTDYRLKIKRALAIEEIFNTNAAEYGGTGFGNSSKALSPNKMGEFSIDLPPLATLIFRCKLTN